MKKIKIIMLFIPFVFFAQLKTQTNNWVKFSYDSIQNARLKTSFNHFINASNKGDFKNKYINKTHFILNKDFFTKYLKQVSKSNFYKDSLFYKPVLKNSYTFNKKDYFLTVSFVGVDTLTNRSITQKTINLKAMAKADYYQFYSVFEDNLKLFSKQIVSGIPFYYQGKFNKKEAKRMVKFTKKLEKMTGKKSPLKTYYKCADNHDALKLLGLTYSMSNSYKTKGMGWHDNLGNFITGENSEAYIHDYIHFFFRKNYDSKQTYREFEEGIAIYYGGNWELSYQEVKSILKAKVKKDKNFNFLVELKKGRKSKRYQKIHLYDRLIAAVLVEHIIKTKDFKTVLKILHCGNKGENLFVKLNNFMGINENNFNNKFNDLLK